MKMRARLRIREFLYKTILQRRSLKWKKIICKARVKRVVDDRVLKAFRGIKVLGHENSTIA